MTVYCVMYFDGDGYELETICSTEELAEIYVIEIACGEIDDYIIRPRKIIGIK